MTFYAQSGNYAAEVLDGFHGLSLGGIIATLKTWKEQRTTRAALNALSDWQLDDVGLHRGLIEEIAARRR